MNDKQVRDLRCYIGNLQNECTHMRQGLERASFYAFVKADVDLLKSMNRSLIYIDHIQRELREIAQTLDAFEVLPF
jgi:uncharacterized protein YukE